MTQTMNTMEHSSEGKVNIMNKVQRPSSVVWLLTIQGMEEVCFLSQALMEHQNMDNRPECTYANANIVLVTFREGFQAI